MSTGPGRIEQAIRGMIEFERTIGDVLDRVEPLRERPRGVDPSPVERESLRIGSEMVCGAAFGEPPWTHAEATSALRAMHRIIAREGGWRTKRGGEAGHRVVFYYEPPAETQTSATVQPDAAVPAVEPSTPAFPRTDLRPSWCS